MPAESEITLTQRAERVLGYLNFSSGAEDVSFLQQLDGLFAGLAERPQTGIPLHEQAFVYLHDHLATSAGSNPAFADSRQAEHVLKLVFKNVLPAYLDHHRDLLFHQGPERLFNSFFVGRACELSLSMAPNFGELGSDADTVVARLNDYIGHRPVAVLESQKLEPYEHEWVRPIPVYIRGVGAAHGRYQAIIDQAITLLRHCDPDILADAQFDPDLMDELAIDPRAFDFEHPVNKRPNHHFGQWDEHHLDNQGNYRRFVVHSVTLEALSSRLEQQSDIPIEELVFEAGAVLAGTILMAAGICGRGPGAHESTVTLGDLLPVIARYRDDFYTRLLTRLQGDHQQRLLDESERRQQPFGAARQHLNQQLARNRAFQMAHVQLAVIFARMGYGQAALRHANVLPVASARMICQLDCLLFSGQQALDDSELALAVETIPRLFELLQRGVGCGAIIDPWNILGFDANYSLFQGNENVVRDHRADELTALMEQIFSYCSQVWITCEAADKSELSQRVSRYFDEIVSWWRKYAVHEVSSVDSPDAREIFRATENVAQALNLWHKSGAETGNVEFWAGHAKLFDSPRAYILAINCLIEHDDFVTSMALLIHWLDQSESLSLQQGSFSFQGIVANWIGRQRTELSRQPSPESAKEIWQRVCKFCDYVEANAGEFWHVPCFELERSDGTSPGGNRPLPAAGDQDSTDSAEPEDDDNPYRAAYMDVVYKDTTDDGIEGPIYQPTAHSDEDLQNEVDRIADRMDFLDALSHYWFNSALLINTIVAEHALPQSDSVMLTGQQEKIRAWATQADRNCKDLESLVQSIQAYQLPDPSGQVDSLVNYDRHRLFKESLLDQAISLFVEFANTARLLRALASRIDLAFAPQTENSGRLNDSCDVGDEPEVQLWCRTLSAVLGRDPQQIGEAIGGLLEELREKPLLYVPLAKGGDAIKIVDARVRQLSINQLLASLPRLGLFEQTRALVDTTLMMERNQSVRQGAVTEFDELFRTGYTSMVQALIDASDALSDQLKADPKINKRQAQRQSETALFDCLEMLTETMLLVWLSHSETLRLSVLEKVRDKKSWQKLVRFIEKFGDQLFTQQFLNLSNIRAILHQGVEHWLTRLQESDDGHSLPLIEELNNGYPKQEAVRYVSLVLESIIENFNEYRDYNCTTTQSDNGTLIYVLLDFLRLRSKYDQVCWNLKPVIWAHESLVRRRQNGVARLWRRLLTQRVSPEANRFIERLDQMQQKYSIQMGTINQRMNERFVHAMHVDRLVSLVDLAMQDPRSSPSQRAFELIEHHAETMTQQPIGVGFELPNWLIALDSEVERVSAIRLNQYSENSEELVEPLRQPIDKLRVQLERLPRRQ